MDEKDFEGTLVLEKLAEINETIALVLQKMGNAD